MARLLASLRVAVALGSLGVPALCTRVGCGGVSGNPAIEPRPIASSGWMLRHEAKVREARQRGHDVQLLFVGDSITQNYEYPSDRPGIDGPADEFAPLVGPHAMNLGFAGDKTQNVLWRLQHGEADGLAPRDIVLLIGINNVLFGEGSASEIAQGVKAVIEQLHQRMPAARITVLALLPTGYPAAQQAKAAAVSGQVAAFTAHTGYAHPLDVGELFEGAGGLRAELYADPARTPPQPALHPNREGQRQMARRIGEALKEPPAAGKL